MRPTIGNKSIAITGHTRGLGKRMFDVLQSRGHRTIGYSLSNGWDLRDWSTVNRMIDEIKDIDWFINCAKPDYSQAQILYRLMMRDYQGSVLNIGSPVVHKDPGWQDLNLLEYATQKTALYDAHRRLVKIYGARLQLWEPNHVEDDNDINTILDQLKL